METLFFTVVALFFLGTAVYYAFQKDKQAPLFSKRKQKPEIISPDPQVYAGGDGAPTLTQALDEIGDEPIDKEFLPSEQIAQEPLIGNQNLISDEDGGPDMDLNEEINEHLQEEINGNLDVEPNENLDEE